MKALILLVITLMTGCTSSGNNARSLCDRLEFGPDECGSFEMNGTVDVNPIPLFSTNLHVELEKQKVCPTI